MLTKLEYNINMLQNSDNLYWDDIMIKNLKSDYDKALYRVEFSKSNLPIIKIKKQGNYIYLNSKYDPKLFADRYINNIDFDDKQIVIIFGADFYLINQLIEKYNKLLKIIVVEPDINILKCNFNNIDASNMFENNNIKILIEQNNSKKLLYKIEKEMININIENIKVISSIFYLNHKQELYKVFNEKLKSILNMQNLQNSAIKELSNIWFKNSVENVKYLPATHLDTKFYSIFNNVPIIIVSAGPSLNKNVGLLKKAKGKALIICVYTALKVLDNENIKPDIVVALDGKQILYKKFDNIDFDMPLVYESNLEPNILDSHKGEKIILTTKMSTMYIEILKKIGKNYNVSVTGASVACASLEMARKLGGNPLVLIGQDLSFKNKQTHAEGTYYDNKNKFSDNRDLIKIKGYSGGYVYTDKIMNSFLCWFNEYIEEYSIKSQDLMFINATEGGAFINGAKMMTFEKVIKEYCTKDIDIDLVMENKFKEDKLFSRNEIDQVIHIFKIHLKDIEELLEILPEAICLNKNAEDLYLNSELSIELKNKAMKEIESFENNIFDKIEKLQILNMMFQNTFIEVKKHPKVSIIEDVNIVRKNQFLYESVQSNLIEAIYLISNIFKYLV